MLRHSPFVMSFQSTLSQGERPVEVYSEEMTPEISIHALARRATHAVYMLGGDTSYFNPRSRKESDQSRL